MKRAWVPAMLLLLLLGLLRKTRSSSLYPGGHAHRPPGPPPSDLHPPHSHHHSFHLDPFALGVSQRGMSGGGGGGGGGGGRGGQGFVDFHDGYEEVGESWEEDDTWWEGVEEVILSNNFLDSYTYEDLYDDDVLDVNFTCTHSLDCREFEGLPPPPNFVLSVPPPPVPPFMEGGMSHLVETNSLASKSRISDEGAEGEEDSEDAFPQCSLCDWAVGGNVTLTLIPPASGKRLRSCIPSAELCRRLRE
ncbi:uncharacterized protein LOC143032542 [Oratosquilla oratoria]|uniref:uncharacterized protein LOC143032542 n=1 Tax=Oratosquilla oratoria TaxID=337810 RepID=UPI003F76DAC0